MEGNRHERVALLITAYIIGFITAFIAYGLTGTNVPTPTVVNTTPNNTSQPLSATQGAATVNAVTPQVDLYADEAGLHVSARSNDDVLLSAAIDVSKDNEYVGIDGAHFSIPFASVSPDRSHVYFCEQPTPESTTCKPFIYNINEEIVYPVMDEASRISFEIASHDVTWSNDGRLVY